MAWQCREGGVRDASRRSSVTRVLHSAFSAVIKEMFMLRMMPRRGERRAQYSTLRKTTPSTPSLHPSTIPILILMLVFFPFLMSPSFPLSPLSSLARCIFGSEWQFCMAPHTPRSDDKSTPPTTPKPTPLPEIEPQAEDIER